MYFIGLDIVPNNSYTILSKYCTITYMGKEIAYGKGSRLEQIHR